MRIAAIISGQTRHFWYACESIYENVIKPNNIDTFFYLSKNSNCTYDGKAHKMDEREILLDCFGSSVKEFVFDVEDQTFNHEKEYYVRQFNDRISNIDISKYTAKNIWYYENGKHQKANSFIDEWLKVSRCAMMVGAKYDIILRIRIDIPWINSLSIKETDKIKINLHSGVTPWAKEYLFYGPSEMMKFCCVNFVRYLGINTESWMRTEDSDDELALVNEVQFGKFITDYSVPAEHMKDHAAGKFYSLYNASKSKYVHLSNFKKDPIVCYLDAGTYTHELSKENIFKEEIKQGRFNRSQKKWRKPI